MTDLTIRADGSIFRGNQAVRARIGLNNQTGARTLTTDLDDWYAGAATPAGIRVDVTHYWHSPRLAELVDAILAGAELPSGFRWHGERDGVRQLRANHPNR